MKSKNSFPKEFLSRLGFIKPLVLKNKRVAWLAGILVSLLLFAGLAYTFKGYVLAAMVNNQPISKASLDRELEKQNGRRALDNMVLKLLILQEAKKNNIQVPKSEIDSRLGEIEKEFQAQGQTLDSYLATNGQSRQEVEDQVKVQIILEKLLGNQAQVSDAEINDYFEKNKNLYPKGTTLESKKEEISQTLKQQKLSDAFQKWADEAKNKAKITYFLNL